MRERVNVPLRGEQNEVRIFRVDEDRWNLLRVVEPQVLPRVSGVCRLVDAIALVDAATGDQVAHADVDDVRIRRRDLNAADGRRLFHVIEDRVPRRARAGRLPHAAEWESDIEHSGLSDDAGDGGDATAAERTDVPPHESIVEVRIDGRSKGQRKKTGGDEEGDRASAHRKSAERAWSGSQRICALGVSSQAEQQV
jgi:hypothetical protein